jgi:hypothetical protein
MRLEEVLEVSIRSFALPPKDYVCGTANPTVVGIFDAALERAKANYEVALFNNLIAFDAFFGDRDIIVDLVTRNCAVLLSDRENWKPTS